MKKCMCVLLTAFMLLTATFALPVMAEASAVTYTEDFIVSPEDVNGVAEMLETAQWAVESSSIGSYPGTEPAVTNGKLILSEHDSVMFDWTAITGFGAYDSAKTYTFEFDFNVTSDGDGQSTVSAGQNREFYFAPGGWFNQIEAKDGKLRAGDDSNITWVTHERNTVYHAKVAWAGTTITSTVTAPDGAVVKTGSRTNASYTDMSANTEAMKRWAFRCEDGEVQIDNLSFTDGTVSFTDTFDYGGSRVAAMLEKDYWNVESEEYTYSVGVTFNEPTVKSSALYLQEGESVAFTWTNIPGMGAFDKNKTYTFDFDVTVTSDGDDGCLLDHGSWIREFFVAPGGWFNQIEFKDGKLRAGGSGAASEMVDYSLNTQYHAKIEWQNESVTTTITDGEGNVVNSGTRTGSQYGDMTANEGIMNHWIFRCEDGEAVMDNFSFTDGTTTFTDSFDYEPVFDSNDIDVFLASDLWNLETDDLPGKISCAAPSLEDGKLVLESKEAAVFNWTNIPDMPDFDTTTEYTFEFDVEMLTYEGTSGWMQSRELYVAPGGYYNQLEFLDGDLKL